MHQIRARRLGRSYLVDDAVQDTSIEIRLRLADSIPGTDAVAQRWLTTIAGAVTPLDGRHPAAGDHGGPVPGRAADAGPGGEPVGSSTAGRARSGIDTEIDQIGQWPGKIHCRQPLRAFNPDARISIFRHPG